MSGDRQGQILKSMHPRQWCAYLLVCLLSLTGAPWGRCGDETIRFDIAPSAASAALNRFARQADIQIFYAYDLVDGLWLDGLAGSYTVENGFRALLTGSCLQAQHNPDGNAAANANDNHKGFWSMTSNCQKKTMLSSMIAALLASGAQAQVGEAPRVQLEEVVVTAQKREETLQDTPIAISVMSAAATEDRGISSMTDLFSGAVPALRVAPNAGRNTALVVGMRGVVPGDASQISIDNAVGIYLDGVYLGRVQGLGMEIADLERIEVLRGPQGTLFGRNTEAGAISIVTKRPTGHWEADIKAGIGNYNSYTVAAHVNFPEVAGVSVKVDALTRQRDGWLHNPYPGAHDYHEIDRDGVRVAALWQPTDTLEVLYAFDKSRDESTSSYTSLIKQLPGAPALAPGNQLDDGRASHVRMALPLDTSPAIASGHSLHAEWQLTDELTLRSITAYREVDSEQNSQVGGTFFAYRPNGSAGRLSYASVNADQFSQELQLIGSTDQLEYVIGAFYYDEDADDSATAFTSARYDAGGAVVVLDPPVASNPIPDRASTAHTKSRALFAQATWTPESLDRLHLTGGLRYTKDEKDGELTYIRGVRQSGVDFDFESSRVDPTATIAYDLSEAANVYLRWGIAYRAGGADSRSPDYRAFDEEELESWEVGLKTDFWDRRARLNLAVYTSGLRDVQTRFSHLALSGNVSETLNGDKPETIDGVEAELAVALFEGFTLTANYSYTDADMPAQTNPYSGALTPSNVVQTPVHAATVALDYVFPAFVFGTLRAHVDADWSTGYYTAVDPTISPDEVKPDATVNARLALGDITIGDTQLEVALWGRNLTNAENVLYYADLVSTGLIFGRQAIYNDPRTYGIEGRMRF